MLVSERIEVTVNYKNLEWYISKGYKINTFINPKGKMSVKSKTKISVKISDLPINSIAIIEYKCDYCGKIIEVRYCDYMRHYQTKEKSKDCCIDCIGLKTKDTLVEKYGVETMFSLKEIRDKRDQIVKEKYGVDNVFQLQEVKDKSRETVRNEYGVDWYTQTEEYKERAMITNFERYRVDNPAKNEDIKQKIRDVQIEKYGAIYSSTEEGREKYKQSMLDRYGVDNYFKKEGFQDYIKSYNLEKYGVEHPMQLEDIKNQRVEKAIFTKYKNGTSPSSRQQDYLNTLLKGEKNYPIDRCVLDIAFPNEKYYIEFDGSGHGLRVKLGECTNEEFKQKELSRKYYLNKLGWKEIRIISLKDLLPTDNTILFMINYAKKYFETGHSWIKFDIDNNKVIGNSFEEQYEYGKLRKIKGKDLDKEVV